MMARLSVWPHVLACPASMDAMDARASVLRRGEPVMVHPSDQWCVQHVLHSQSKSSNPEARPARLATVPSVTVRSSAG